MTKKQYASLPPDPRVRHAQMDPKVQEELERILTPQLDEELLRKFEIKRRRKRKRSEWSDIEY
jgi:hypothetical protein